MTGEDCSIEYRIHRTDGELRWLRELGRAKEIREGRVVQTLGVIQDVTDQIQRAQALVFKDAMASQAEEITDIGYFLYDLVEERHLFVSEGQARIVGMTVEEFRDKIKTGRDYICLLYTSDAADD